MNERKIKILSSVLDQRGLYYLKFYCFYLIIKYFLERSIIQNYFPSLSFTLTTDSFNQN